jgi:hypothetical protein
MRHDTRGLDGHLGADRLRTLSAPVLTIPEKPYSNPDNASHATASGIGGTDGYDPVR